MTGDAYTVVGAGAIGGTLAHRLAAAGHQVTVIDTDAAHVAAIQADGLTILRGEERESVRLDAATPDTYQGPSLGRVLLSVKAQATDAAMEWIAPRLAPDGYVVSVQNGFNEALIAEHVGAGRTVAAFVNIFADLVEPGVVRDGGPGAFVIGEVGGAPVSARVRALVADLQAWGPALASDNVEGYLWAKAAFGAMLSATALADAPMADLTDRHRATMYALTAEVYAAADAAGIRLESFDAFEAPAFRPGNDPALRDAACDRLTAWLRTQPKDRSGIWRDLAVRRRPVEVTTHYATVFEQARRAGLDAPVLRAVLEGLRELEQDPSTMSESRLDALDRLAGSGAGPADPDGGGLHDLPAGPVLTDAQAVAVHRWLDEHRDAMDADLAAYTSQESSSDDTVSLAACLDWLHGWLDASLGAPASEELIPREDAGDIMIRRYAGTGPSTGAPLLLVGHYDTVWSTGTLADWPYRREGDRISGPGVFDMKAGLVQAVWALRALTALGLPRPECTLLLNGDEETGSEASSGVIVAEARKSRAALVFEASADGAVKTTRKGVGLFSLTVTGVEAHAGLDPTSGASAVVEIARQVLALEALADPAAGTTVNVGVLRGGTRSNVTAGEATAHLDIRVATSGERARLDAALAGLAPVDARTGLKVEGGWNRPVFERTEGVGRVFALARSCAAPLGLDLRETAVGGASDGNFILAAGTPVLDGLGAVGGGAHARGEHVTLSGMVERSALAAGVLAAFTTV
ncbi:2-dehydropantoate 2-reductase [Streptomyces sp. JV176]|uniref:2-dehydropantoate 2-reductase n=1 Tax=Streptomyces sp. JV176 TaxID=858630 RepID=UPI002E7A97D0|nr:2-dehydropantoate 2-reductase [Streptomyces sp. JV176]MEE1799441.1 2-dehydropantoate 2-reductase [Streptomyces sp. JV176]